MNIVIFGKFEVIPEIGGTERVSASLAKMLKERGYGVYFVALAKSPYSLPYTPIAEQIILPDGITWKREHSREKRSEICLVFKVNRSLFAGEPMGTIEVFTTSPKMPRFSLPYLVLSSWSQPFDRTGITENS